MISCLLLYVIIDIGLTGTKLGCGACTVMVSYYDEALNGSLFRHCAVNACLAPLHSVEGMHIVTVEGIGNRRHGLHPVQVNAKVKRLLIEEGDWQIALGRSRSEEVNTRATKPDITEENILESLARTMLLLYSWFCHVHVCIVEVTGEAEYVDDAPMPPNGLHAALVLSRKPNARILSFDDTGAQSSPAFAGLFGSE
ncbi:hypothetical protein GIB67_033735 [Kingdonia uniflora]|uniref:Aldehyde oxidase/xanthine dehydrogenase a/b hammerhead domain-containing protein n=1 Tax=Kingdonia uniflora TaxID=39325 RepID=A0A7J7P4F2_9MAGN|nr:hypothetical protein GIB67_033735 [Kingdonia uniflora]